MQGPCEALSELDALGIMGLRSGAKMETSDSNTITTRPTIASRWRKKRFRMRGMRRTELDRDK